MYKILLLLLFCTSSCFAQLPPPPATVAEVEAGTDTYKYVTPYTLAQAGITGGGGAAVSNATVAASILTRYTNNTDYLLFVDAQLYQSATVVATAYSYALVSTNYVDLAWTKQYTWDVGTDNTYDSTFYVIPGGVFRWTNSVGNGAMLNQRMRLTYFSTNSGSGSGSGDVTQSGLAAGSYVVNGQPITNYQSILSQLLNGSTGTSRSPGSHSQGGNNASNYVVSGSGTSGILKSLFCHLDVGSTGGVETNIQNLDLLIYTDGTATGNLTARIRVADLMNCRFRYPTTNWTIRSTSRFISFYTDPLSERSGFPLYHFTLTLPMPFTNGISCRLTNTTYGGEWTHGYFQAQYELKSLPPELQTARLYITNVYGSITSAASNYLFTTSGATEIVGFQVGASNHSLVDIEGAWADKGIAFFIDSTLFTYDLDDWLENTYAGAFGEFIGYDLGWPHNDYNGATTEGAMESYKWLVRDSIRSTNTMVIYSDAFAEIESAYYNFFYYKR